MVHSSVQQLQPTNSSYFSAIVLKYQDGKQVIEGRI